MNESATETGPGSLLARLWARLLEFDWRRPSTWLLAAVVVANLLVAAVNLPQRVLAPAPDPSPAAASALPATPPDASPAAVSTSPPAASETPDADPEPAEAPEPMAAAAQEPPPGPVAAPAAAPRGAPQAASAVEPAGSAGTQPEVGPGADPVVASAAGEAAPAEPACRAWGPFPERDAAAAAAADLGFQPDAVEIRERSGAPSRFLVTVPGPPQRVAALRMLQELLDSGVDSQILNWGEDATTLSVGIFSTEQRAETQRLRVQELGFEGTIRPFARGDTGYHVVVRMDAGPVPDGGESVPCSEIAPPQ